MTRSWFRCTILAAAVFSALFIVSACGKKDAPSKLTIAVIPKGTTHSYWKSVHAGAINAGNDLGVTIKYDGPMQESDIAGQQALVEGFIADGVDGIVLAPTSDAALLRAVQDATAKKIPVVIIDSALKGEAGKDYVSYVSTNNKQGGVMAGDAMTRILNGNGKIVMLRYAEYSASTNEREAGFLESIHKTPGLTMLVDNRYAGATEAAAQTEAENLLDQLRQADGVFCSNESATLGMLHVLEQNNLTGKVHFVGFDATDREVDAMKKGEIEALVSQNPVNMGYLGVKTCVDHIQGKSVDPVIDSGVKLITPANLNDPEIQKFLAGG